MERHVKWFEKIQTQKERTYYPIPDMFHIDPIVKMYNKGGDEGHLYIVKIPEQKGFKIGSTTQLGIRMYYYPIGTELLFCKKVDENLRKHEKRWIRILKNDKNFKLIKGKEWFSGNYEHAIDILLNFLKTYTYEYQKLSPKEARLRRMNIMHNKHIGHYTWTQRVGSPKNTQ
jgi:hypothetical protein